MQDALDRLIMVAPAGDGVDGDPVLEVEHGNDLKGHGRAWCEGRGQGPGS